MFLYGALSRKLNVARSRTPQTHTKQTRRGARFLRSFYLFFFMFIYIYIYTYIRVYVFSSGYPRCIFFIIRSPGRTGTGAHAHARTSNVYVCARTRILFALISSAVFARLLTDVGDVLRIRDARGTDRERFAVSPPRPRHLRVPRTSVPRKMQTTTTSRRVRAS